MLLRYRSHIRAFLLVLGMLVAPVSVADSYPDQPIRFVISFTAGGSTDLIGREYAAQLEKRLDQPMVIENKPGAGGNIGTGYVSKSKPDGYTLLIGNMGPIAVNPALMQGLKFDSTKDLTAISPLVAAPNVLVISSESPLKSFDEFKKMVQSAPDGSVSYASTGVGTAAHLSGFALSQELGKSMLHVPYKGSGGLVDVVADRILFTMATAPSVLSLIRDGRLRPLLITGDKRLSALPDVPAASEYQLDEVLISAWYGIFGPPNLPSNVVERISRETSELLASSDFINRMDALGATSAIPVSSTIYSGFVASELTRMKDVVKELSATAH